MTKSVDNPTPIVGDTVTYTIVASDNGPDPATNVVLTDLLPAGLAFVSGSADPGGLQPGDRRLDGRHGRPGAPQTLTITATVVSPAVGTNTATVSHADQFDPNTANNSRHCLGRRPGADLAVTKRVDNPRPNVGDPVTFTVTAQQHRAVRRHRRPGHRPAAARPHARSWRHRARAPTPPRLWDVGTLLNGAPATLTLRATVVSPAAQTNVATVTASDQPDPNPGNDTAGATETPQQADLAVAKAVSNPTPERRGHDHLHRHPHQRRPRPGHERRAHRPVARRPGLRRRPPPARGPTTRPPASGRSARSCPAPRRR